MSTLITFEHPLNERIRTFLRLDHLFRQLDFLVYQEDPRASRSAVTILMDIIAITARADVKNELIKELDRYIGNLDRLSSQRGIDPDALAAVMDNLKRTVDAIHALNGPIGHSAREDEFLKSIALRSSIPGGTCSFDLPHFHYWLLQEPELRQARFLEWLKDLKPAIVAIELALSLVRSSSAPRQMLAEGGFYQEALDAMIPAQMLRVSVAVEQDIFPEISGHKNRFSIRFMSAESRGRAKQHFEDVMFRLTCCVF